MRMSVVLFFVLSALLTEKSVAAVCSNASGSPTQVSYDLTSTLTKDQNQPGQGTQLVKSQDVNIQAVCPSGSSSDNSTYRSYVTNFPVVDTDGSWQYLRLDPDYIEGAMKIHDSFAGDFYPPVKYTHMGVDSNVNQGKPFNVRDSNLIFKIRIVKSFIGTVTIPQQVMFNVYVTTHSGDPLSTVVYQITYSGTITVPQSCEINAGQTVLVDFGTLYSGDFKNAGQKPDDAPVKTFNVPIQCNGSINYPANLTLRVQATADAHFTQAVASDNADVGVVIADPGGKVLTPNDLNSNIPFTTDAAGKANVSLQAYPISTTGKSPAEGVFTALAFLRVDFA